MSQVESSPKSNVILQFRDRFARSSTSRHVVSALIVVGLFFSITWVWNNSLLFSGDRVHSAEQIEEALGLISDSKIIRLRHESLVSQTKERQKLSREINVWLPTEIDWETTALGVEQLASKSGVLLVDMQKNELHTGVRVSVQSATCRIAGSFEEICQFLQGLSQGEKPVWCDGIVMTRSSTRDKEPSQCDATLTLRFPIRGQQTIADKLASLGDNNAT